MAIWLGGLERWYLCSGQCKPCQVVDTKSTLGKKVVAQNSTLIHPGPQVNSTGIHSFSHKFSTLSKPFSIRHDENLANHFSERQEFYILKTFYCPELDVYLVVTPDQGGTGFSLTAALVLGGVAVGRGFEPQSDLELSFVEILIQ
jgi:hypothetical protein